MSPRVKAAWLGARISAPAYPVTCAAGDNLAIHVAVAEAPAGHVLVASVGAEPERGYWGEVLTTGAEARGIVGLVIDGGVRDVSALEAHGFPVFSSMIALRGATKEHAGPRRRAGGGRRRARAAGRLDRRRRRRRHRRPARAARRRARRRSGARSEGSRVLRSSCARARRRSTCSGSTPSRSRATEPRCATRRAAAG